MCVAEVQRRGPGTPPCIRGVASSVVTRCVQASAVAASTLNAASEAGHVATCPEHATLSVSLEEMVIQTGVIIIICINGERTFSKYCNKVLKYILDGARVVIKDSNKF